MLRLAWVERGSVKCCFIICYIIWVYAAATACVTRLHVHDVTCSKSTTTGPHHEANRSMDRRDLNKSAKFSASAHIGSKLYHKLTTTERSLHILEPI